MTNEHAAERLREYADMLERANVHDDMGLSLTLTQAADAMRDAAERLTPTAEELPPALAASIELFRENPSEWHAEWQRMHDFKVRLLTENAALKASLKAETRAQDPT